VFLLKEGKAKQHVMRDFSKTPINTDEELNNWLKFYNMSAPLVTVGTLINSDHVTTDIFLFWFFDRILFSRGWTCESNTSTASATTAKLDTTTSTSLLTQSSIWGTSTPAKRSTALTDPLRLTNLAGTEPQEWFNANKNC
jgi:hypothetical protein